MAWRIEATSTDVAQGDVVDLRVTDDGKVPTSGRFEWKLDGGAGDDFKLLAADGRRLASEAEKEKPEVRWSTAGLKPDSYQISVRKQGARANQGDEPLDSLLISVRASGDVGVTMARTRKPITDDVSLWAQIRRSSERIAFSNYNLFMRALLCGDLGGGDGREVERSRLAKKRFLPFNDSDAYRIVKVATEAFLEVSCDVVNGGIDLPPFSATDARLTGRPAQQGGNHQKAKRGRQLFRPHWPAALHRRVASKALERRSLREICGYDLHRRNEPARGLQVRLRGD